MNFSSSKYPDLDTHKLYMSTTNKEILTLLFIGYNMHVQTVLINVCQCMLMGSTRHCNSGRCIRPNLVACEDLLFPQRSSLCCRLVVFEIGGDVLAMLDAVSSIWNNILGLNINPNIIGLIFSRSLKAAICNSLRCRMVGCLSQCLQRSMSPYWVTLPQ